MAEAGFFGLRGSQGRGDGSPAIAADYMPAMDLRDRGMRDAGPLGQIRDPGFVGW